DDVEAGPEIDLGPLDQQQVLYAQLEEHERMFARGQDGSRPGESGHDRVATAARYGAAARTRSAGEAPELLAQPSVEARPRGLREQRRVAAVAQLQRLFVAQHPAGASVDRDLDLGVGVVVQVEGAVG